MAKPKYITDAEAYNISVDIYNDNGKYIDDWDTGDVGPEDKTHEETVKEITLTNEDFTFLGKYLPGDYGHMALTNYGSLINGKKGTRLRPMFTAATIHYRINQIKLDVPLVFFEQQWLYDLDFIKDMHKDNEWYHIDKVIIPKE
jgi:hypothetical protein